MLNAVMISSRSSAFFAALIFLASLTLGASHLQQMLSVLQGLAIAFLFFLAAIEAGLLMLGIFVLGLAWAPDPRSVAIAQGTALTAIYIYAHSQAGLIGLAYPITYAPQLVEYFWLPLILVFGLLPLAMHLFFGRRQTEADIELARLTTNWR